MAEENQPSQPVAQAIRDWSGQISNADPHDLPVGAAQVQINCFQLRTGELRVRRGLRTATLD